MEYDPKLILDDEKAFYETLYSNERLNATADRLIHNTLSQLPIPKLSQSD